jgi:hypothetical protein
MHQISPSKYYRTKSTSSGFYFDRGKKSLPFSPWPLHPCYLPAGRQVRGKKSLPLPFTNILIRVYPCSSRRGGSSTVAKKVLPFSDVIALVWKLILTEFSENSLDRIVLVSHLFELLAVTLDDFLGHLREEIVIAYTFAQGVDLLG